MIAGSAPPELPRARTILRGRRAPLRRPHRRGVLAVAIATAMLEAALLQGGPLWISPAAAQPAQEASPSTAAPAAATAANASAGRLEVARALVDRRDFAAALPIYAGLLAARPDDTDLLIETARVNGFADRNAESARLYRRVLEVAPQRRADVRRSLAWQTLWSGDATGAEPLFVESAAADPDPADAWRGVGECRQARDDLEGALAAYRQALAVAPGDRTSARRAALQLVWLDRHDEGIAAFEALVARDPSDRHSRLGLARALNDAGRHRAAIAAYREAAGYREPTADAAAGTATNAGAGTAAQSTASLQALDADARFDYARALRWAGFDDLADAELAALPQADAQWLRNYRTARERSRWLRAGLHWATDRDELDVRAAHVAAGWNLPKGRAIETAVRHVDLEEPDRDGTGLRWETTARGRYGAPDSAWGVAWPSLTIGLNRYDDWHPLTGGARLRWLPRDDLRVDAELVREVVETPLAVANRVHVDVASVGADWRPRPLWSVAGAVSQLHFDDGNDRLRVNARVERTLHARPRVRAGVEAMAFSSSDPTSDTVAARGYWNPRDYREARAYLSFSHEIRPWDLYAKLGLGSARETDGWDVRSHGTPHVWEVAAALDLDRSLQLRLVAGGSGNGMGLGSGGAGYWRRYAGVELTGWF